MLIIDFDEYYYYIIDPDFDNLGNYTYNPTNGGNNDKSYKYKQIEEKDLLREL